MIIRTAAVVIALAAAAAAQAPAPPPPKPKVISMPKQPKPKLKPKPKPAADPAEAQELPPAADPAPATPAPPPTPAPPKRSRAIESTLSAYMPKVKAALGTGWAAALQLRAAEFQPGNVSVTFKLDLEGKVTNVTVTENSSNAAFGKFCEEHIRGITFAPPPAKALEDGTLEIPFTFWLY